MRWGRLDESARLCDERDSGAFGEHRPMIFYRSGGTPVVGEVGVEADEPPDVTVGSFLQ